jgi:hypothetical protein
MGIAISFCRKNFSKSTLFDPNSFLDYVCFRTLRTNISKDNATRLWISSLLNCLAIGLTKDILSGRERRIDILVRSVNSLKRND